MPRTARQLSSSSVYHVMLRGVNREALFHESQDFDRFVQFMALVREVSGCLILAYCLMPNHVHLVIQAADEPIGLVIKRLGVRYAGWFNRKYDRVGHLFQDRFKSNPVEDDSYLIALLGYVWANPVTAGLAGRAEEYPWSSRRLLGHAVPWVDEDQLRQLVPSWTLDDLASGNLITVRTPEPPPVRLTDDDVAQLLWETLGTSSPGTFSRLGRQQQADVVKTLRAEGASIRQCARATGLTVAAVRRREARNSYG